MSASLRSERQDKASGPFTTGSQPRTPPHPPYADLPTPPTSHIEMSATTRPGEGGAASSQTEANGDGADADRSPTALAVARKAERANVASTSASRQLNSVVESGPSNASTSGETARVLAEAQRRSTRKNSLRAAEGHRQRHGLEGLGASSESEEQAMREAEDDDEDDSDHDSERSRTPSPVLGLSQGDDAKGGRIGFGASIGPSAEEIHDLVYGDDDVEELEEAIAGSAAERVDLDSVMKRLEEMGIGSSSGASKEQELVNMVRSLGERCTAQERLNASLKQALHSTRVRAISSLSSLRAQYLTSLSNVELQTSLLESELEGARAQAKMLGAMLARSEARNDEMDRERAMSVEEEMHWQEAMKGHAEAWRQQQAARAALAAGPGAAGQQTASANQEAEGSTTRTANGSAQLLQEPFEMDTKRSPGGKVQPLSSPLVGGEDVTGLGISSFEPSADATRTDDQMSSPMSLIIKERNKLLGDKRYLRQRVRDAEAQRERLEQELRAIRPLLVRGGTKTPSAMHEAVMSATNGEPTTPGRSKRDRSSRRKKVATMGDAEAEHLILAARRFRETQRQEAKLAAAAASTSAAAADTTTAAEDGSAAGANASSDPAGDVPEAAEVPSTPGRRRTSQAPSLTDPSDSTSPLLPQTPKTPRMTINTTNGPALQTPRSGRKMADVLGLNEPPLTQSSPGSRRLERWGGHERTDSSASASSFNGPSGIDELLSAAQAVQSPEEKERQAALAQQRRAAAAGAGSPKRESRADQPYYSHTPGRHPPPAPMPIKAGTGLHESPKRRRVSSTALDLDRMRFGASYSMSPEKRGMGFAGSSARRNRTHTEGAEPLSSQGSSGAVLTQQSSSSALSALDLLADQAAASQQPSQSSDNSPSGDGGNEAGFDEDDSGDEGMAVDGEERGLMPPRSPFGRGSATSLVGFASSGPTSAGYSSRYGQSSSAYSYPHSPGGRGGAPPALSHSPGTRHPPALPYGPYAPRGVSPPGGRHAPLGAPPYGAAGQPPPSPLQMQPSSPLVMQGHHVMHHGLPHPRHPLPPSSPSMPGSHPLSYPHVLRPPADIYDDPSQSPSVLNPPTTPKSHSTSTMPVTPGNGTTPKPKGGNTSPDKRLPYVRWSEEEDRKLRKAIGQHGQRWEAVARDVGSRSYHQCRQRYLLMRRKEAAKNENSS